MKTKPNPQLTLDKTANTQASLLSICLRNSKTSNKLSTENNNL